MAVAARSTERRLVLVIGAVVFVDLMFYAAIAPLLPALAHELHLSKLSAGVMTAGYPAGVLAGGLPGGILAVRAGAKRTVIAGLLLLSVSTFAFGWLHTAALLDLTRFLEGFGSSCAWTGGLAWVVSEAPAGRRGAAIGNVLGAAVAGSLFGPVIGTIAGAVGRGPAFSGAVVVSLVLVDQVRRLPLLHTSSGQGLRSLGQAMLDLRLAGRMWLVVLPAAASGVLFVLGPFRLHRFGAAAGVIGAIYVIGAGLEASVAPLVGRLSDRRGRMLPVRIGLAMSIPLLLIFSLPHEVLPLALVIVALAGSLGTFWAPSMAMLSDAAEARGLDQALAAALINLAWAVGQIIGSTGGGGIAKTSGDAAPMAIVAALCAVTLVGAVWGGRRGEWH